MNFFDLKLFEEDEPINIVDERLIKVQLPSLLRSFNSFNGQK